MIAHPRRGNPILAVVRRIMGRRHEISRAEMAAILAALETESLIEMDNGWGGAGRAREAMRTRRRSIIEARDRADDERLRAARRRDPFADSSPPSVRDADLVDMRPTAAELAEGWTDCCRGIQVISILAATDPIEARLASSNPGTIRYDEPGRMHPQLRATLMFVAGAAAERRATLEYLRERAKRVLIVTD